jgi:hypothetical protein
MAKKASKKVKFIRGGMAPQSNLVPPSAMGSAISAAGPVPSANIISPSPVPSANLSQQIDQIEMAKSAVMPQAGASLGPTTVTQNEITQTFPKKAKAKVKKKVKKG